jgi:hypothetical protein
MIAETISETLIQEDVRVYKSVLTADVWDFAFIVRVLAQVK